MKRLIGIDLGGTGIKMGVVEIRDRPRILSTRVQHGHADRDPKAVCREIAAALSEMTREVGGKGIEGIGVGSAGLIRPDAGIIEFSPNLPAWSGAKVASLLSDAAGLPVTLDNDANAFALAEWRWGAGDRSSDAVFLTLGTGIGGALITEGRLLRGAEGFAGEPGHTTLVLDGEPCPCGNRGCAERYIGNEGIVAAAREHPGFDADARLTSADPLTPAELSRAAEEGSRVARDTWDRTGRALGSFLVGLINLTNPKRVVIGGGIAEAGELLFAPAREVVEKQALVARYSPPRILHAALGEKAGLLGSAALALDDGFSGA